MNIEFSRYNPPRVLIPTNDNHLGARNVLSIAEFQPVAKDCGFHAKHEETPRRQKRTLKPQIVEHKTYYEDHNKPRPTALVPPDQEMAITPSHIMKNSICQYNAIPITAF